MFDMASEMTLRSTCDIENLCTHPNLLHAKLCGSRVNGSRITRYAYGLFAEAVASRWFTKTVSITIIIDYTRYYGSFEILKAKVKCHISTVSARPLLHALNKQ